MAESPGPPRVSVVVPTRLRSQLLGECLRTIADQQYPKERFEVLVVDDGPSDETHRVTEILADRGMDVRYLTSEGRGINAARNTGLRHASGELVWLVDDDELVPPGTLGLLVDALNSAPEIDGVGGGYRTRIDGKCPSYICKRCRMSLKSGGPVDGAKMQVAKDLLGGNALLRVQAIKKVGPFDESLSGTGDDMEWFARARTMNSRFLFVREAYVWHRVDARNLRLRSLFAYASSSSARHLAIARRQAGWSRGWTEDMKQSLRFFLHSGRRLCVFGFFKGVGHALIAFWWGYISRGGHSRHGS